MIWYNSCDFCSTLSFTHFLPFSSCILCNCKYFDFGKKANWLIVCTQSQSLCSLSLVVSLPPSLSSPGGYFSKKYRRARLISNTTPTATNATRRDPGYGSRMNTRRQTTSVNFATASNGRYDSVARREARIRLVPVLFGIVVLYCYDGGDDV